MLNCLAIVNIAAAFSPDQPPAKSSSWSSRRRWGDSNDGVRSGNRRRIGNTNSIATTGSAERSSSTSLNALIETPPYFFTFAFPMLGIIMSVSRGFSRRRLEESAWEQRLEEARSKRLRDDPSLTEMELRRNEAELEWSAYGNRRREEEEREYEQSFRRRGVKVAENGGGGGAAESREYRMSDDEINQFEMEYGVEYDPYYDDPYAEDELPKGNFKTDNKYGDRVYDNGEIFYKDKASGLFYRQGAKPRNLSFW